MPLRTTAQLANGKEPEELLGAGVEGAAGAVDGADEVVEDGAAVVVEDEEEDSVFLAPELLYRSEYQPPPFRMKAPPPEIWRFAVFSLHFGHVSRADSEIRCSTSQALPQAVHAYS